MSERNTMSVGNGGDLLVQVLREAGVDTVFGIVSVHNQPLVQAVAKHLRSCRSGTRPPRSAPPTDTPGDRGTGLCAHEHRDGRR